MVTPIDSRLTGSVGRATEGARSSQGGGVSFSDMLQDAFDQVNRAQLEADALSAALAAGEVSDVHQVMIATEKANLALQLTISIRNRMIEAYQEIARMQI